RGGAGLDLDGAEVGEHLGHGLLGDLPEDRVLGVDVAVEGALRDARLRDDVGHPGVDEAAVLEHRARGGEQLVAAGLALVGLRACVAAQLLVVAGTGDPPALRTTPSRRHQTTLPAGALRLAPVAGPVTGPCAARA